MCSHEVELSFSTFLTLGVLILLVLNPNESLEMLKRCWMRGLPKPFQPPRLKMMGEWMHTKSLNVHSLALVPNQKNLQFQAHFKTLTYVRNNKRIWKNLMEDLSCGSSMLHLICCNYLIATKWRWCNWQRNYVLNKVKNRSFKCIYSIY